MIVDVNAKKQTASATQQEQEFNYRNCWYPICFVQDGSVIDLLFAFKFLDQIHSS